MRMKKFLSACLILLAAACPLILNAQWAKTFGWGEADYIYAIAETPDGGFVAVGSLEYPLAMANWIDSLIIKLSSEGEIEWSRSFGGYEHDWAESVFPLTDGGIVVAGNYEEINNDLRYCMIQKLDAEGTLVWQRLYWEGDYFNNRIESIEQTADGGFILLGLSYDEFVPDYEITVTKLDAAGNIIWNKIYRGANDDYPGSIQQTADGGYIVAASSRSFSPENRECWLLRLDSEGEILWQRRYAGGTEEWAYDVLQTSDGGFILSGWTTSYGAGGTDCWILKIRQDGTIDWQKAFGGSRSDAIYSIQETADGGYIAAGATTSFGAGSSDGHITKLTESGKIAWQRTYGGPGQDVLYDIQQTSERGFVAAGYTTSFGAGERDAFVLCLDANGNIGSSCPLIETSIPVETVTAAISNATNLVSENFSQTRETVNLFTDFPELVVSTLCQADKYTLVINTTSGGTTDPAPGSYIYSENSEVNIEAIPLDHSWRFDLWSGDVPGGTEANNPVSITMDGDKEITAHFKRAVLPPLQFTGSKVMNRSLSQREHINLLSWASNPENVSVVKYRIYLTEGTSHTLLAELDAQTFFYWHRNVEAARTHTYTLTAVNDSGIESEPATTTIQ